MYAAHLAAGLALRTFASKVSAWPVLVGTFMTDLVWVALAVAGVEPTTPRITFDGWSHSAVSTAVLATAYAACFRALGTRAMFVIGLAVASHLPLDAVFHPVPIGLWPHAPITLGDGNWDWGSTPALWGRSHRWWTQAGITILLLGIYVARARELALSRNLALAGALIVASLHLVV